MFKIMSNKYWWQTGTFDKTLSCVYCGNSTLGEENLEHIIPESLGCKDILYAGAVCKQCNNRLGINVERDIFKEALMASGQVATGAEGKNGKREQIGPHVKKSDTGVIMNGAVCGKDYEFQMSRVIAKSGVNIFTHYFGSASTREKYLSLVSYVLQPKSRADIWPYAAIFTPAGGFANSFGIETVTSSNENHPIFLFMCASGVFASSPNRDIDNISELIHEYITESVNAALKASGTEIVRMSYVTK